MTKSKTDALLQLFTHYSIHVYIKLNILPKSVYKIFLDFGLNVLLLLLAGCLLFLHSTSGKLHVALSFLLPLCVFVFATFSNFFRIFFLRYFFICLAFFTDLAIYWILSVLRYMWDCVSVYFCLFVYVKVLKIIIFSVFFI